MGYLEPHVPQQGLTPAPIATRPRRREKDNVGGAVRAVPLEHLLHVGDAGAERAPAVCLLQLAEEGRETGHRRHVQPQAARQPWTRQQDGEFHGGAAALDNDDGPRINQQAID